MHPHPAVSLPPSARRKSATTSQGFRASTYAAAAWVWHRFPSGAHPQSGTSMASRPPEDGAASELRALLTHCAYGLAAYVVRNVHLPYQFDQELLQVL